jgi:hypothetical protein
MMKALQFIPDILQLVRKISYQSVLWIGSFVHLVQRIQNQRVSSFLVQVIQSTSSLSVKAVLVYLSKAFGEGLKQNFLGPNIDTGFAVLTVKVYAVAIVKTIAHNPIVNSIMLFVK